MPTTTPLPQPNQTKPKALPKICDTAILAKRGACVLVVWSCMPLR